MSRRSEDNFATPFSMETVEVVLRSEGRKKLDGEAREDGEDGKDGVRLRD